MRTYDFKAAKKYIQMHSDVVTSVSMGMKEDWVWTAQTVYEDLKFVIDLDEPNLELGGIASSNWATPCMFIEFRDGTEIYKPCYLGEATEQKPEWFSLGCLSQPIQDKIDGKPALLEHKQETT